MAKYNIALIMEEIAQSYQSTIITGIESVAAECSMSISAFVSFSSAMNNSRHDKGEFNIFSLPDFSRFDGAILLTNTIAHQSVTLDILKRIKEAEIPAVSIDSDVPFLNYIGIDNKTAMRNITNHLIRVHGCSDFYYISGPTDNPESVDRLNAFREVLNNYGITAKESDIYYGDFRAPSGKAAVEKMLSEREKLPDAIICANDVMATSAINCLISNGYDVPNDIAVTGFDNTYSSRNYKVELTSVDRPLSLSGRLACKMLCNRLNNIPQERSIILKMSTRFTESCGCCENINHDVETFRDLNYRNYMRFEESQEMMSSINEISTRLLGCNKFKDYISCLKEYIVEINPDEFYFCLCDKWSSESEMENGSFTTEYTDFMEVPIAYIDRNFYDIDLIETKEIIPDINGTRAEGKIYYHIPLHFGERCLGYMVICNPSIQLASSMFETLCISISNSLENMRKVICLEYAIDRLGKLYAQDSFSGIYNRNGFIKETEQIYKECIDEHKEIMLMFIDLDGLKKINDTFGHSVGDTAICCIADVLRDSCKSKEVYCRFGGDEFIIFAANYNQEKAELLKEKINSNIEKINLEKANPFVLSASSGYIIDVPEEGEDIFSFVTKADNAMYEEKRRKKLHRLRRTSDEKM